MRDEKIERDGPGSLTYGDTLTVKGIREYDDRPEVALSVFGNHVEVEFLPHKRDGDNGGLKPNIPRQRSGRELSDEQEKYIKSVATIVAGMFFGWWPKRIKDLQK